MSSEYLWWLFCWTWNHFYTFNCNKAIGVLFCPKKCRQPASFSKWCRCTIF